MKCRLKMKNEICSEMKSLSVKCSDYNFNDDKHIKDFIASKFKIKVNNHFKYHNNIYFNLDKWKILTKFVHIKKIV